MPATDLRSLREYVANVLDYSPTNPTYQRQLDRLLNEADLAITTSKAFTFVQKAVDVTVYADASETMSCTNGVQTVTTSGAFFEAWMVNQEVSLDDVTYTIVYVASTTSARLERDFESTTASYTGTVINRYIDLPADCSTVLGIARRTDALTPSNPGMLAPLSRYEDEWYNLPLGEVNLPTMWLYHDPAYLDGPRRNFDLAATTVGAGQGVRTLEFTSTYMRGGRESSHGEITTIALTDTQGPVLTPMLGLNNDGLLKRYYFRCPDLGFDAWRLLDDPNGSPGDMMELQPTDVTARTFTGLRKADLDGSEQLYLNPRLANPDGFIQRVRLYPRQDQSYTFTVRYMQRHTPMVEDGDVSCVPPDQRMVIAYTALADVLIKHDNPTQAELYRRRADAMLLRIERRYLVTPSRRIVKGNWLSTMEPNSYSRFSTLVHS